MASAMARPHGVSTARAAPSSAHDGSARSKPAENARPSPATTTTFTSGCSSNHAAAAASSSSTARLERVQLLGPVERDAPDGTAVVDRDDHSCAGQTIHATILAQDQSKGDR